MALNWVWNKRVGYMTLPSTDERCDVFNINLYIGSEAGVTIYIKEVNKE